MTIKIICNIIFCCYTMAGLIDLLFQHYQKPLIHFLSLISSRPRNIQWSKINDTLPERAEISGPTFQISRLSQSHNGTYLCQAQNNYGRAADHYTLLVYGEYPWLPVIFPASFPQVLEKFLQLILFLCCFHLQS